MEWKPWQYLGTIGIVSPAYGVYRIRQKTNGGYLHYLLRIRRCTRAVSRRHLRASSKAVFRLYSDDLFNLEVPLPPLDEQRHIVAYLDRHGRRFQRLVDAKQRLIALLEEQKQAIIQRAVTRGLDPDAPTKDSGVDWLGEIPAHWDLAPLKRLARFKSGDHISSVLLEDSGAYPVYGGNGLRGFTNDYTHSGDYVLIGRQGALCGNVNYARGQFWATEHAVVATLQERHEINWFGEMVRALNLNQYSQSAAQPGLSIDQIKNVPAPIPPPVEQHQIADYLKEATHGIESALKTTQREIDLIREYRTRLVADVVTGRLDVRPQAAATPAAKPAAERPASDRGPNVHFRRATVAAGITHRLRGTTGFGRVQLQKALYVVERDLRLDLGLKTKRHELGPFDNRAMRSVHSQFERSGWFRPVKRGGGWVYEPLPKLGAHARYLDGCLDGQTAAFERLMRLFTQFNAEQAEIVATLYAAWNDEIIAGTPEPSDDAILAQVLDHWHPSKRERFSRTRWQQALAWMRDPEGGHLVPTGHGASTRTPS